MPTPDVSKHVKVTVQVLIDGVPVARGTGYVNRVSGVASDDAIAAMVRTAALRTATSLSIIDRDELRGRMRLL